MCRFELHKQKLRWVQLLLLRARDRSLAFTGNSFLTFFVLFTRDFISFPLHNIHLFFSVGGNTSYQLDTRCELCLTCQFRSTELSSLVELSHQVPWNYELSSPFNFHVQNEQPTFIIPWWSNDDETMMQSHETFCWLIAMVREPTGHLWHTFQSEQTAFLIAVSVLSTFVRQ